MLKRGTKDPGTLSSPSSMSQSNIKLQRFRGYDYLSKLVKVLSLTITDPSLSEL